MAHIRDERSPSLKQRAHARFTRYKRPFNPLSLGEVVRAPPHRGAAGRRLAISVPYRLGKLLKLFLLPQEELPVLLSVPYRSGKSLKRLIFRGRAVRHLRCHGAHSAVAAASSIVYLAASQTAAPGRGPRHLRAAPHAVATSGRRPHVSHCPEALRMRVLHGSQMTASCPRASLLRRHSVSPQKFRNSHSRHLVVWGVGSGQRSARMRPRTVSMAARVRFRSRVSKGMVWVWRVRLLCQ